ncbi:hypothetical protein [Amycolatopsis suaedae]|uniref:Uncharacterized protein n=1 Tax=Amycolatopsis suaedae TaxID=2510978 RepID=A0A4Q7JCJ7_9PSEU|nr:hypothetical protein [Amycolatopsis suaedae]RZQ65049.1 hypothetical protein EWH70_03860 [Amycolatopsis suaedae]
MAETAKARRDAASVGRWAARALLVLGGIVAGWLLAVGSASASDSGEAPTADLTPVTDATVAGLGDVTGGVADLFGTLGGVVVKADPKADQATAREVAGKVRDGAEDFAEDALLRPAHRALGSLEHIVRKPDDAPKVIEEALKPSQEMRDLGEKVWKLFHPEVPDLPALPVIQHPIGGPATDVVPAPITLISATDPVTVLVPADADRLPPVHNGWSGDGGTDDSDGSTDGNELPAVPVRLPVAPGGAPTYPGGGSGAGAHLDGLLFGVPAGTLSAFGSAVIGSVRTGSGHLVMEPGAQPGVTPD